MLLRVAVVAALFACLHSAPALAAPTVTIDSGPDGPTNESSPTFGFTVENATAVECSVDQGTEDFGPCTTASSHTDGPLADGDWTFRVRATDDVPETTTETRDFTVDTAPPTVTLGAGGPTGPTNDPQPSFSWTAAGDDQSLRECSLDSGTPSFGACTSPTQYDQATPLDEGSYTFRIRVEDEAGNTATDTRTFSVDLTPPTVTLGAGGPTGPTNDPQPSFSWTAAGDDQSLRECSLDSGTPSFGACTSPTQYDQATPLDEGSYTFRIRVEDEAGNTATDTRTFSVDLTPPTVTLTALGPTGPTNDSRPSFGWTTAAENARECSVDQGTINFGPCTSLNQHDQPSNLADGAYTFRVRVTDPAGNTASATRDFSVDTVGPMAEVTGPKRTGDRKPSFQVSSPEAGASVTCKLDGKPAVGCGPSFAPDRHLKFGKHKLLVTAHDTLGNPGPPRTFRFKVLRPPLEQGRAERTVATALRRHKFAKRVIDNLERSCTRRGRYTFSCRFSSAFPGYSLKGHGRVELRRGRISYRFVVRAQGEKVVLTDENEGRFPG